jgi:hypothetical protein
MTTVKELIHDRDHILVGFDRVLCAVDHHGRVITDRLKILVSPGMPANSPAPRASCGSVDDQRTAGVRTAC